METIEKKLQETNSLNLLEFLSVGGLISPESDWINKDYQDEILDNYLD